MGGIVFGLPLILAQEIFRDELKQPFPEFVQFVPGLKARIMVNPVLYFVFLDGLFGFADELKQMHRPFFILRRIAAPPVLQLTVLLCRERMNHLFEYVHDSAFKFGEKRPLHLPPLGGLHRVCSNLVKAPEKLHSKAIKSKAVVIQQLIFKPAYGMR